MKCVFIKVKLHTVFVYVVEEILIPESFAKINPTDPLILSKQSTRRKRKWVDSSGVSLPSSDVSRCECKKINEESRHQCGLMCQLQTT